MGYRAFEPWRKQWEIDSVKTEVVCQSLRDKAHGWASSGHMLLWVILTVNLSQYRITSEGVTVRICLDQVGLGLCLWGLSWLLIDLDRHIQHVGDTNSWVDPVYEWRILTDYLVLGTKHRQAGKGGCILFSLLLTVDVIMFVMLPGHLTWLLHSDGPWPGVVS